MRWCGYEIMVHRDANWIFLLVILQPVSSMDCLRYSIVLTRRLTKFSRWNSRWWNSINILLFSASSRIILILYFQLITLVILKTDINVSAGQTAQGSRLRNSWNALSCFDRICSVFSKTWHDFQLRPRWRDSVSAIEKGGGNIRISNFIKNVRKRRTKRFKFSKFAFTSYFMILLITDKNICYTKCLDFFFSPSYGCR